MHLANFCISMGSATNPSTCRQKTKVRRSQPPHFHRRIQLIGVAVIVEEEDEDNMEEIDTDNIIPSGRRTRGKTIDFAEAAKNAGDELEDDEDDDDDDFEEKDEEMHD